MKKLALSLLPLVVASGFGQSVIRSETEQSDSEISIKENPSSESVSIGALLLKNREAAPPKKIGSSKALSDFFSDKLDMRRLLSVRLVSSGKDAIITKGPDALPLVKPSGSKDLLQIAFRFEIEYDKSMYYSQIAPKLASLLEQNAVSKIVNSSSIGLQNPSRGDDISMAVTRTPSFQIPPRLNLSKQTDRLVFSGWQRNTKIDRSSIYIACNVGRDSRGRHQRFATYQMDKAGFDRILRNSPGRAIPPLHLVLEDSNGSVIRQDRWFPRVVMKSKSDNQIEQAGNLTRLCSSHGQAHYDLHSASYSTPLSEGIIRMDEGSGRQSCFTLAPWFTFGPERTNQSFFADAPVFERVLEMYPEDLERVSKIRLFF